MNKLVFTLLFLFLSLLILNLQAQNSYIQVFGEEGLFVFLNGQFKGKTSTDIGSYVVENVTPGPNTLKIVKDCCAPNEEVVIVKPGVVFAYKVKPFSNHKVLISEQGKSRPAKEQVKIEAGKLIIQSVPIEIKFSISDLEGYSNLSKTKDQWMVESVPAGQYTIEFSYNQKKITKTVEILANETTKVFVNMLSSEITIKNTSQEKKAEQQILNALEKTMDSLCQIYSFKVNLSDSEFRNYNTEVARLLPAGGGRRNWKSRLSGPLYYELKEEKVYLFHCVLEGKTKEDAVLQAYYQKLNYFLKVIPSKYLIVENNSFSFTHPYTELKIRYYYCLTGELNFDKYSYLVISFDHIKR